MSHGINNIHKENLFLSDHVETYSAVYSQLLYESNCEKSNDYLSQIFCPVMSKRYCSESVLQDKFLLCVLNHCTQNTSISERLSKPRGIYHFRKKEQGTSN